MKCLKIKILLLVLSLVLSSAAYAGAVVIGINLDFIQSRSNDVGFDGGLGVHAGYEFKDSENWHFGGLFEVLNSWNTQDDLYVAGDLMYKSKSLLATARPGGWPIMFKAGIVDAEYKVLEGNIAGTFLREVNSTGYVYGLAFVLGDDDVRLNLLDYKRIKIGRDTFDAFGISLMVLMGN